MTVYKISENCTLTRGQYKLNKTLKILPKDTLIVDESFVFDANDVKQINFLNFANGNEMTVSNNYKFYAGKQITIINDLNRQIFDYITGIDFNYIPYWFEVPVSTKCATDTKKLKEDLTIKIKEQLIVDISFVIDANNNNKITFAEGTTSNNYQIADYKQIIITNDTTREISNYVAEIEDFPYLFAVYITNSCEYIGNQYKLNTDLEIHSNEILIVDVSFVIDANNIKKITFAPKTTSNNYKIADGKQITIINDVNETRDISKYIGITHVADIPYLFEVLVSKICTTYKTDTKKLNQTLTIQLKDKLIVDVSFVIDAYDNKKITFATGTTSDNYKIDDDKQITIKNNISRNVSDCIDGIENFPCWVEVYISKYIGSQYKLNQDLIIQPKEKLIVDISFVIDAYNNKKITFINGETNNYDIYPGNQITIENHKTARFSTYITGIEYFPCYFNIRITTGVSVGDTYYKELMNVDKTGATINADHFSIITNLDNFSSINVLSGGYLIIEDTESALNGKITVAKGGCIIIRSNVANIANLTLYGTMIIKDSTVTIAKLVGDSNCSAINVIQSTLNIQKKSGASFDYLNELNLKNCVVNLSNNMTIVNANVFTNDSSINTRGTTEIKNIAYQTDTGQPNAVDPILNITIEGITRLTDAILNNCTVAEGGDLTVNGKVCIKSINCMTGSILHISETADVAVETCNVYNKIINNGKITITNSLVEINSVFTIGNGGVCTVNGEMIVKGQVVIITPFLI